ncbi:unnamed protein product [Leuciscus chuanchicus]
MKQNTTDPLSVIGLQPDMDTALTAIGTTTKPEAMLMIMSHAAKHKITGCQLHDLLQLINKLFGQEVVPRSKQTLLEKEYHDSKKMTLISTSAQSDDISEGGACKLVGGKERYPLTPRWDPGVRLWVIDAHRTEGGNRGEA